MPARLPPCIHGLPVFTCPPCRKAYRTEQARKYREDPEIRRRHAEAAARWREKDPRATILVYAKHRAKKSGLEFTITVDDIVIPARCPILGIELKWTRRPGSGNPTPNEDSPTIDRTDNSRGYVPGNVAIISMRANRLKNSMSVGEACAIAEYLLDITAARGPKLVIST